MQTLLSFILHSFIPLPNSRDIFIFFFIPKRKIKLVCVKRKWGKITYWNKMNWHKWISTFTFFYITIGTRVCKAWEEKEGKMKKQIGFLLIHFVFMALVSIRHTFALDKMMIILFDMQLCYLRSTSKNRIRFFFIRNDLYHVEFYRVIGNWVHTKSLESYCIAYRSFDVSAHLFMSSTNMHRHSIEETRRSRIIGRTFRLLFLHIS